MVIHVCVCVCVCMFARETIPRGSPVITLIHCPLPLYPQIHAFYSRIPSLRGLAVAPRHARPNSKTQEGVRGHTITLRDKQAIQIKHDTLNTGPECKPGRLAVHTSCSMSSFNSNIPVHKFSQRKSFDLVLDSYPLRFICCSSIMMTCKYCPL